VYLGYDGSEFNYDQLPCPVTFEKCSAKSGDLASVLAFLST